MRDMIDRFDHDPLLIFVNRRSHVLGDCALLSTRVGVCKRNQVLPSWKILYNYQTEAPFAPLHPDRIPLQSGSVSSNRVRAEQSVRYYAAEMCKRDVFN